MFITESNEAYHKRPEVSASMLKLLRESPRKYQATVEGRIERKESPAMKIGSAIHARVLEPELFTDSYVLLPNECKDKRTKKYKEWAETAGDRIPLTEAEWEVTVQAKVAIANHPIASMFGPPDHVEKSVIYTDPATGQPCRLRFDIVKGSAICDIKTISECDPEQIERDAAKFGYHLQAAHYLEGMRTVDPDKYWRFFFIFVETSEPFRCRVFRTDDEFIYVGCKERDYFLADLRRRMAEADWSEPRENEINVLALPKYYRSRIE